MKRNSKLFQTASGILFFALVIFFANACGTKVAKSADSILTSSDGLWLYEYVNEDSGETVVSVDGYKGTSRELVIPGEIDGYVVRYIGRPGGWNTVNTDKFDSITLPDSVTGLLNVPFFAHSHNLEFMYLGKNYGTYSQHGRDINMIKADDTYDIQTKEYRVSAENKVITASDGVLYSKDMKELKIYPSLKEDITFTVPDGVISIDSYAMNNLQYLENLILPYGITEIGTYCCKGSSISSINIPDSLTTLNHGIFYESKLKSVVLPGTISTIGGYVFTGTPIEEVIIPDNVISLGAGDFMNCDKLKRIVVGSGVTSIGGNCFYGLASLETFEISKENPAFKSEGGMLLAKDGSELIQYAAAGNTKLILPEGVTTIGPDACYGMPFDEIVIPDSVVSVGDKAFENCANAKTVYVPSSVTTFGNNVFSGCTSLKTVKIDAPVKSFSGFSGCDLLTEIILPETITSISDSVFFGKSLHSVYLNTHKAPSISYSIYIQWENAETELVKRSSNVRIFVPEDAQGYDVTPWNRMHVVYGDTVAAKQLVLNPSSLFLDVGETVSIQTLVSPEDAIIQDTVWETSNGEIASVDKDGQVKALSSGTTIIKATAGELSAECIVTVKGNHATQNFCIETSGGTASSNYNAQNYTKWSSPVKSYILMDKEGYMTRVEFINGRLVYETYSMDGILKENGSITDELPLAGGFYVSGAYKFIVYGQSNSQKSDSAEIMRIVKYDQDWNRVSSCSLYGENTRVPFDAGCLRFTEYGDTLYIRTSHLMYDGHQANLQVAVDMSSMKVTDTLSGVANIGYGGYVSHSFNQFSQMDGEDLVTLDHGDSYPRAAVLIKYPDIRKTTFTRASIEHFNALVFPGMAGNNNTNASLGGLEISEHYYIFAGNYANNNSSSVRNIFISITGKDFLENPDTRMVYLTDFGADSGVTVSTPHLVKVNEKTFLVLWNETNSSGTTVHSQMIDENGNKTTSGQSFHGMLSDCHPVVQNGQVIWYYTGTEKGDTTPIFCRIPVDGSGIIDNLVNGEGSQEDNSSKKSKKISDSNVTLSQTSYTYDGKQKMPSVIVKDGNTTLVKDIDYTVTYKNNINVGTATATVNGKGNYTGTVTKKFTITEAATPETTKKPESTKSPERKNLSGCIITISQTSYTYDGKPKMPLVTVKDGNTTLVKDIDYTITYSNNINAGTAIATITGKGNYTGTATKEFTITETATPAPVQEKKKLQECVVTVGQTSYTYDGKAKKPAITAKDGNIILEAGTDYTIIYSNNINAGTAKVTVTGKGNYEGTVTKEFKITINKGMVYAINSYQYKVTGASAVSMTGVTNDKITKIKVPKTVEIGGKTFNVTSIGSNAFKNNKNITNIETGNNLVSIGISAFENCTHLLKVTTGNSITKIGANAFKNCKKLGSIKIKSVKLQSVGKNALKGIKPSAKIKVPAKKVKLYKKKLKGKGQSSKVKIIK